MNKKIAIVSMLVALCIFVVACGTSCGKKSDSDGTKSLQNMTPEEILYEIYKIGGYSERLSELINSDYSEGDDFTNHLVTTEINEDNCMCFFGTDEIPFESAVGSEPAINPTLLHTVCVIKLKSESFGENAVKLLRENVDPMKWVCTGLSSHDIYIGKHGDIVVLVMNRDDGEKLLDAFYTVCSRSE